ncbi:Na+/H+ antiporter NhaC family protein [bacterium]|nr:Na+/H+ antiporter NhaC family protein [bacterium]
MITSYLKKSLRTILLLLITASVLSGVSVFAASDGALITQHHWSAILPPLIAITFALIFREVILSLLLGIFIGSLLIVDGNLIQGMVQIVTVHLLSSLSDSSHAAIILFSLMLGGMVGVFSRAGGTEGIIQFFSRISSGRRGGMILTWILGILIFFDDYANTLMVGNTMRSYTDRLKISRAKLAYIVDSTAAPVASIAFVSTWIGFEVGLLRDATGGIPGIADAYVLFIQAIPYHFYSIFALFLVLSLAIWQRDFGPMRKVELSTQSGYDPSRLNSSIEKEELSDVSRHSIWVALVPILLVILSTFIGLYWYGKQNTGGNAPLFEIFGAADSTKVLLIASFVGLMSSWLLGVTLSRISLRDTSEATLDGFRSMMPAMVILVLAWSLGNVCDSLGTAQVVVDAASGILSPHLIPMIVFLISAITAFSTGTSWGTMAILIPIVIPLSLDLSTGAELSELVTHRIFLASIGAVLAGATFGDHCSPISDTTILSSMASGCDHIYHVRTQIPYALIGGFSAIFLGYIPAGFGMTPWISVLLGIGVVFVIPRFLKGKMSNSA